MSKRATVYQRSFAGGKLSEAMKGRIDSEKYPIGLDRCENFVVMPHGPAKNRAGTIMISEVPDSSKPARVVPFSFSDDQTYALVINAQKVAFSTDGGMVASGAQTVVSMTKALLGSLEVAAHGRSTGDVIYVVGVDGFDRYAYKVGAIIDVDNFYVLHMDGSAVDTRGYPTYVSGGTVQAVYTVTVPYADNHVFGLGYAQSADVMTFTHTEYAPRTLSRLAPASWSLATIAFEPAIAAPTGLGISKTGAATGKTYTYVVTAIAADGLEESLHSSSVNISSDLDVAGNTVTVTWSAVSGAIRYNVYRDWNGLYGFVGATEALTFTDTNFTPDVSLTPPDANNPFNATNKYPATVCYFDQRKCFANTNERPSTVWMTRSATERNLTSSIPSQDNDAIQMRVAARELNEVRHLVPMADLLMLTSSSEWMITSKETGVLTPSSTFPREQAHYGANEVHPILASNAAVYARSVGGHVASISLTTDSLSGGYRVDDLSILSEDLFDGYDIVDLAYSSAPLQTVWAVRNDGRLLGLTYYPEHKVYGWHEHTTDGAFESCAAIREGGEDVLYLIVRRVVAGVTKRYLERMHSRTDVGIANGVFSDCCKVYSGSLTSTITGLWHLEGKQVNVLNQGAHEVHTVSNGAVTVDSPTTYAIVGLPYRSYLRSMPLIHEQFPSGGLGLQKQITALLVRVVNSGFFRMGAGAGLRELPSRSNEPYGSPPALFSGVIHTPVDADWGYDAQFEIENTAPLPITVDSVLAYTTFAES